MADVRELEPGDAPELTALYEDYEWWADREEPAVRRALEETDLALGAFEDGSGADSVGVEGPAGEGALVGAARVLTDFTYYATVYDVIVAADRRGEGVGRTLLVALREHPALQELPGLALLCREGLVPFYESVGFEVFHPEMAVPEGGSEDLVRMTIEFGRST